MSEFKQYRRTQIAEMRLVTSKDISEFKRYNYTLPVDVDNETILVSISQEDRECGSPKIGDMIARNPKNNKDQWLVAKQYFDDNFEAIL